MSELLISLENQVRIIKFNRPDKKNAINDNMYDKILKTLKEDAENDDILITVFTGSGDFYSSGNDMAVSDSGSDYEQVLMKRLNRVHALINAFLTYPKILVALVNGPAIGVAATTAALCDIVYATENAWFETPFVKLGICAEGCSSYLFPRMLGRSVASEMLFLSKRLSAQDAHRLGFVSEVVPQNRVNDLIVRLQQYDLPIGAVKATKRLILDNVRDLLCECNTREFAELKVRFMSDDFFNALMKMSQRKSKL